MGKFKKSDIIYKDFQCYVIVDINFEEGFYTLKEFGCYCFDDEMSKVEENYVKIGVITDEDVLE